MKSGLQTTANLLLMGVLLNSVVQWLILGVSYPGAALVVGPVLVMGPYVVARALSNRLARWRRKPQAFLIDGAHIALGLCWMPAGPNMSERDPQLTI